MKGSFTCRVLFYILRRLNMDKKVYVKKEDNWLTIVWEYKSEWMVISISKFLYWKPTWFAIQKAKWSVKRTLNKTMKVFLS